MRIHSSPFDEGDFDKSINKLTFLIPNFRTNSTITLGYDDYEKFGNLFKVCHEKVCKENITSYYFEQGKSYQIYVKLLKKSTGSSDRYDYLVPPFNFYAEDYDEEYSNDDIKYTYNEASNYRQMSIIFLIILISFLF